MAGDEWTFCDNGICTVPGAPQIEEKWVWFCMNIGLALFLVLLGGLFAGLTLAFMGQDEVYLQVMRLSGTDLEKKYADKVLRLLQRRKHWILVTLLLGNVITNEALPILIEGHSSNGWPAIFASTALIVVFGEIIPQSVCARYKLAICARSSSFVQIMMYLLSPVGYPVSRLLDNLLGEEQGIHFGTAGLKIFIRLQKTLQSDEVAIVSSALDLKRTWMSSIMTPISNVYTLGSDEVMTESVRYRIMTSGFNYIPVHIPGDDTKMIGMLTARDLITNESEVGMTVANFKLSYLPVVSPEYGSLDMLKYFVAEKKEIALVTDSGTSTGRPMGIVTQNSIIENMMKPSPDSIAHFMVEDGLH